MEEQELTWYREYAFDGEVLLSNHALFTLFDGILSLTEKATILMHALSADTHVICSYVFHYLIPSIQSSFGRTRRMKSSLTLGWMV
mmetsp:Transcript_22737/g.41336  ORF Transcript_22737/g.41336 Transcript_22737/m.41336 type:complete len:86 (+) Transcript_22737:1009-1266(+)